MIKKITLLTFYLVCSLIAFSQVVNITNADLTVASYTDKEVIMTGKSTLHITASSALKSLTNTTIRLNSENSWLFFDNIRPQVVIDSLLKYVTVNGNAAVLKTNARVSIYKHGAVVIPHSSSIQPLKVYTSQNFTGDSAAYSMFTYYNGLGTMDNKIRSFKLKRGYMATFATSSDGLGYSRVFIADDKDLEVAVMPNLLDKAASFIRVFDWEWVTKKGWCGTGTSALTKLNTTWGYDWSAFAATTSWAEYVPMHAKLTWAPFSQINGLQYVSHSLGFNEPDHPEQHKDDNGGKALTVSQALAQWPDMLKSGLRVGAPACTDFSWLYSFMDSCKAKNYRVDYVAVHSYWGAKSPASWYNDLKYISQRTGRPIWITEWNNGANWTNETWPTADRSLSPANAAKQLSDIKAILNVLDTASFIERYSIYDWVQDCRAMILADTLTPAGKYYAADKSVMAFNKKYEVIPTYTFLAPSLAIAFTTKKLTISISDPNGDYYSGMTIEKKVDNGTYSELVRIEDGTIKSYSDTLDLNLGLKVRYRARAIYNDGSLSPYTNELGYDVTNNSDIQLGTMSTSNTGYNTVLFKKPYAAIPTIIVGSPTNVNSTVYMSARPKLISASSRFNIQLAPWSYQKVSTLTKEETVPYFAIPAGTYDFGGLKAIANRATANATWTPVTFATPFTTVPVVFVSQLSPATTFATCVRVRNVTTTGFEMKLMKETAVTTALASETVSYFAITTGTGLMDGKKVIVGKTGASDIKSTTYTTINYGDSIANPIFLTQLQTCNDDTVTATMRCLTIGSKFSNVMKQREKSTTATYSLNEAAGWMAIDPLGINAAVFTPSATSLKMYPNPVTDYIQFEQNINDNTSAEIFNMYGVLVKRTKLSDNQVDVRDLPAGSYILKTSSHGSNKFIKIK
jgi:hypothetical protein